MLNSEALQGVILNPGLELSPERGLSRAGESGWTLRRAIAVIFFLYIGTTIYMPKLNFGMVKIYPFEILSCLCILFLLVTGRLRLRGMVLKTYAAYFALASASFFTGVLSTGVVDVRSGMLLFKFFSFILAYPVAVYVRREFSMRMLRWSVHLQTGCILACLAYVVFHMVTNPMPLAEMAYGYSQQYRVIGFTGHGLDVSSGKVSEMGHTSVQMGIYAALLFCIYFSLFHVTGRRAYLLVLLLVICALNLTYSKSGMIVMLTAAVIFLAKHFRIRRYFIFLTALVLPVLLYALFFTNLVETLTGFGTLGKIYDTLAVAEHDLSGESEGKRILYWTTAAGFFYNHPWAMLIGTGWGEGASHYHTGVTFFESLFVNIAVQCGVAALLFMLLHFFFIWKTAAWVHKKSRDPFIRALMLAYVLFMPGFFIGNCLGGNVLETDFYAPFFYFTLGYCVSHTEEEVASAARMPQAGPRPCAAEN